MLARLQRRLGDSKVRFRNGEVDDDLNLRVGQERVHGERTTAVFLCGSSGACEIEVRAGGNRESREDFGGVEVGSGDRSTANDAEFHGT